MDAPALNNPLFNSSLIYCICGRSSAKTRFSLALSCKRTYEMIKPLLLPLQKIYETVEKYKEQASEYYQLAPFSYNEDKTAALCYSLNQRDTIISELNEWISISNEYLKRGLTPQLFNAENNRKITTYISIKRQLDKSSSDICFILRHAASQQKTSQQKLSDRQFSFLCELSPRLDETSSNGNTTLHWAILRGHIYYAKAILECGAKQNKPAGINYKNKCGSTPLHLALAVKNSEALVKLLLDHNAKTNLRNTEGQTPLEYAEQSNIKSSGYEYLRIHMKKA